MEYPQCQNDQTAKDRFSSEEKRALDKLHNDMYNQARHAAEAHRQVLYCFTTVLCHCSYSNCTL